jgi:hypothetical protein
MISATYFGEITELDSRAVWYSDEEDDDDEEEEESARARTASRRHQVVLLARCPATTGLKERV